MEPKDILTVTISVSALIISAVATTISIIRGQKEKQRSVRNQITDTLSQIIAGNIEKAKLYYETAEKNPEYFQSISSILNQQNAFLLNQAIYLTDQVPELVTAVEYNTLATANVDAGDLIMAERYFRKAIDASTNEYYKSLAMRSYGVFLFTQRRFEEGREVFRKSVSLLKGGDNLARQTKGFTYQMWAWNELNNAGSIGRATELVESASNEFKGIDNEAVRRDSLRGLEAAMKFPSETVPNIVE
jgi:tetratricopeptide (TPR) repeat protein